MLDIRIVEWIFLVFIQYNLKGLKLEILLRYIYIPDLEIGLRGSKTKLIGVSVIFCLHNCLRKTDRSSSLDFKNGEVSDPYLPNLWPFKDSFFLWENKFNLFNTWYETKRKFYAKFCAVWKSSLLVLPSWHIHEAITLLKI